MFKRILVPTDGSDIVPIAIARAVELAKLCGAGIEALCVTDPFPFSAVSEIQPIAPQDYFDLQEKLARQRVDGVATACSAAGVSCETTIIEGLHPYEAIIEHAERKACDLIVMASHGRRGMSALLLGSETQKVLTHSKVPVLVVR
ncbi:universal stress protein [Rivibacter subsaxonicus]|uniref:Nucleotide-binding universal stress UspA family protein n=1 Tax=Rivibacter subsaxonicus TaxID=457575 RepID=A0A4Q7W103_9BURK|nr:universal stress protein [Rivibacter subsaxonicus]RZU02693.1 nucleotide-binding universal stress UspA family protein [Rivibacter subsaxonicus]